MTLGMAVAGIVAIDGAFVGNEQVVDGLFVAGRAAKAMWVVKNSPSIRAVTTDFVSSRMSSFSVEATEIRGMRSQVLWTCGWTVGMAFL
jgi:hypothetical protein